MLKQILSDNTFHILPYIQREKIFEGSAKEDNRGARNRR
jgi:hypothetical protein